MAQIALLAIAAIGAVSSVAQGIAAEKRSELEAAQLEAKASQAKGAAQLKAAEERRQGELLRSRATAVAAASGAGVDDPTVLNTLGDITAEGEIRALYSIYNGDIEATDLTLQAQAVRDEGDSARTAGYISGVTSIATAWAGGIGGASDGLTGAAAGPAGSTMIPLTTNNQAVMSNSNFVFAR